MTRRAMEAAFCDLDTKRRMIDRIDRGYAD
jgi:hypothetical protein